MRRQAIYKKYLEELYYEKKLKRFVSFVSAVVMIALFSVNAFAAGTTVTYKSYYSFTSMMQNEANNYNVEFTTYMKPTVEFASGNNKVDEITKVSAYITIAWKRTEALPNPPKNIVIEFYLVQYYQPATHYSEVKIETYLGKVEIKSLFDSSVSTSTGYKYTSPTFSGTAVRASDIINYGGSHYDGRGFTQWRSVGVVAKLYSTSDPTDLKADSYVIEDYSTVIADCRSQL